MPRRPKADSLELAKSWGSRLKHLHLTDGSGSAMDEHMLPWGRATSAPDEVLAHLVESDSSTGHVVLEVNTRSIGSRGAREHAPGGRASRSPVRTSGSWPEPSTPPDADQGCHHSLIAETSPAAFVEYVTTTSAPLEDVGHVFSAIGTVT